MKTMGLYLNRYGMVVVIVVCSILPAYKDNQDSVVWDFLFSTSAYECMYKSTWCLDEGVTTLLWRKWVTYSLPHYHYSLPTCIMRLHTDIRCLWTTWATFTQVHELILPKMSSLVVMHYGLDGAFWKKKVNLMVGCCFSLTNETSVPDFDNACVLI